jgi:hypothetical protein
MNWMAGLARRTGRVGALLALLAAANSLPAVSTPPKEERREVLLVAGPSSHGSEAHEFPRGAEILAEALNASGLPITASVALGWPEGDHRLTTADALVLYSDGGEEHVAKHRAAVLRNRLAHARGLVVLHYALEPPEADAELRDVLLQSLGAVFEPGWSVNPIWHVDAAPNTSHVVARGVERLKIEDEWYYHLRIRQDAALTPVLVALPSPKTLGEDGPRSGNPAVRAALERGEPQLLGWTFEANTGARGFGFTGGHFHRHWYDAAFRTLVLNAIVWAAGLEVPTNGVASAKPSAPRYETIDQAIARGDAEDVERHLALDPQRGNSTSNGKPPPLHQAILRRHAAIALTLIARGSDIHVADTSGRTPLHLAVIRNVPEVAARILELKGDPHQLDQQGWTPLHHAAARKDARLAALLLEGGTDPNVRSGAGGTPLHEAAASGGLDVARLLLAAGTDPTVRSGTGVTALDLAREYGHPELVQLLQAATAK